MILCAGITAAEKASLKAGSDDYKQAVIDAIASGTVEGVTGTISYEGTGDPVKSTLVITFKSGEEQVFDTIKG